MDIYRITLMGHRELGAHQAVEDRLYQILRHTLRANPCVEIYVGRNGAYDLLAASVVKRIQREMGRERCELILVLPYTEKDMPYYEKYYDCVMIPDCLAHTHPKGAITKRNRWMVEQCDLLICYVERESGGAYTALKYAARLGKDIINLAANEPEINTVY